ncbi:MAG TPA: CheR family methyltransferase [Acidimicrobiales bacterium]|nr:CheR family methyltransferase [Acidimicrobiales bacterium]
MTEPPSNGELDALLAYIHERRNFDFRGYKRASLARRVSKRMGQVGADTYERYTEVLEANPGEFADLFNTMMINVTAIRRDPDAWEALAELVIPGLVQGKAPDDPIRVWSAGCASGEEAYSLAVALADAVGDERFRRSVKIYATDADTDALVAARHGRYPEKDLLDGFGEERARQYFEFEGGTGVFRSDLRRSLIFGRHDLVQDPPISRIDLIACRNTLMYFTAEVQLNVLATLHFALNPGGWLFLGKSEALVGRTNLFHVVNLSHRIFRKDGANPDQPGHGTLPQRTTGTNPRMEGGRAADLTLESIGVATVVLDNDMVVLSANREARRLLSIGSSDFGRSLGEAALNLNPADLRSPVDRALRTRQHVIVQDVVCQTRGDAPVVLDVVVAPLEGQAGAAVSFLDVSRYQHLRDDLERSQRELEAAYEGLQSAVEELETTNEELQSTNEELETTNEELHSTNEELETMNEELHSTNEELETINKELRERSAEVQELNEFLESILASLQSAVVVLDPEMWVQAWNRQAEELWGLRRNEVVGQHFLNLDTGFPVDALRSAIRASMAGERAPQHLTVDAVNRRGRLVRCAVNVSGLVSDEQVKGVLVLMDAILVDEAPAADRSGRPADADQASVEPG